MAYVRWEARLRIVEEGASRRAHLEKAAERGSERAVAALEGPPFPEALGYLYDWLYEVHGRSGVDMGGLSPLTYQTVAEWARLTERVVEPHEVQALMQLDLVLRLPDAGEG